MCSSGLSSRSYQTAVWGGKQWTAGLFIFSQISPVGDDVEVRVLAEVEALHVHVEVPAHQDRDAQVVGAEGAHKLEELAHVPRPGQII